MASMKAFAEKLRELLALAEEPQVEVYAEEGDDRPRLFLPFAEPQEWINYLPNPGKYAHKSYGSVEMTPERAANFVATFKSAAYQKSIPIDLEHGTKQSGAAGWIEDMRLNDAGGVDAKVSWTDMGKEVLARDRFRYFSPEITDAWTSPLGVTHKDVAIGGALTTRPYFKESSLRSLAASEDGTTKDPQEGQMSDEKKADDKAAETPPEQKAADTAPAQFTELSQKYSEALEQNKVFAERLERMEADSRRKAFSEEVLGKSDANGTRWFGESDKHVAMLEKLTKAFGENSAEVTEYVDLNRSHAKSLEASMHTRETGVRGIPLSGSVAEQFDGKVKAYREAHTDSTEAQAVAAVYSENPDLVHKMRNGGDR